MASKQQPCGYGLLYDDPDHRFSPAYFNLGVLAIPAPQARKIGDSVFSELDYVVWIGNSWKF